MKSIYLIGFMGAGKTSIGQALAEKLALPIFDTDLFIEKSTGLSINELFEKHGENEFRLLEEKTLKELPTTDAIIMTGGGMVTSSRNMEWMKSKGLMLFLYSDIQVILQRLENDETRPLIHSKTKEEIETLYNKRLPLYKQAHITVDTTNDTLEGATEMVFQKINSWQSSQH